MNETVDGETSEEFRPALADKYWIRDGLCDRHGEPVENGLYEITNILDELIEIMSLYPSVYSIAMVERAKRFVVLRETFIEAYGVGIVFHK